MRNTLQLTPQEQEFSPEVGRVNNSGFWEPEHEYILDEGRVEKVI